ncbi:MAG: hypothetical protein DWQ01_13075 [Planctomycetota bacterium]|nr:MAG: hypothetical protein DWQ01_13075 [Planctomycetota bacterium]
MRLEALKEVGLLEQKPSIGDWSPPSHLGEFELGNPLGHGGMGMVYEAWQPSLRRRVALKIIRPDLRIRPHAGPRFRREIETVARLQHPNILPIYSWGEHQGVAYFVMERLNGCTLAEAIRRLAGSSTLPTSLPTRGLDLYRILGEEGRRNESPEMASGLPALFEGNWEACCVRIGMQVAQAIHYAHQQGVMHRDLKPSNLFLTQDGRALLFDFGLASEEGAAELTASGTLLGSLPYMAPEHFREPGATHSRAMDIYGLGVTLYELMCLEAAFPSRSAAASRGDWMQRIVNGQFPSLKSSRLPLSEDAIVVCEKAMALYPKDRYATARDLAEDLGRVLRREPTVARPLSRLRLTGRWVRNHPGWASSLGIFLMAAILLFFLQAKALRRSEGLRFLAEAREALLSRPEDALGHALQAAKRLQAEQVGDTLLAALEHSHNRRFIENLNGPVDNIARSPDGAWICAVARSGESYLWDREFQLVSYSKAPEPVHFAIPSSLYWHESGFRVNWTSLEGELFQAQLAVPGTKWEFESLATVQDLLPLGVSPYDQKWIEQPRGPAAQASSLSVAFLQGGVVIRKPLAVPHDSCLGVGFHPARPVVALGGRDGKVDIWDLEKLQRLNQFQAHSQGIWGLSFSPDGSLLALPCEDASASIWDWKQQKILARLEGHRGGVFGVRFDAQGRRLASFSEEDRTVCLWKVEDARGSSLQPFAVLGPHPSGVRDALFLDQSTLLTVTDLGQIFHWSIQTYVPRVAMEHYDSRERKAAVSGDGRMVATLRAFDFQFTGPLILRSVESGDEIHRLYSEDDIFREMALDFHGETLAVALGDSSLEIWQLQPVQKIGRLSSTPKQTLALAWSPGGKRLATVGKSQLEVFSFPEFKSAWKQQVSTPVYALQWSQDGKHLYLVNPIRQQAFLAFDGKPVAELGASFESSRAWISPHEKWAIHAIRDGVLRVQPLTANQESWDLLGHETEALDFLFFSDGVHAASASRDGTIRIWDMETRRCKLVDSGHRAAVFAIVEHEGRFLRSLSTDGWIRTWPVDPIQECHRLGLWPN